MDQFTQLLRRHHWR